MSKRLQVIIDEKEYSLLKRHAQAASLSLGAWVRMALRRVIDTESVKSKDEKLKALKTASTINAPVDDLETMNQEIGSGYLDSN
jgi:hypothetical protein